MLDTFIFNANMDKLMLLDSKDRTFTALKMQSNQADNVHALIEYFPSDINGAF